MMPCLLKSYCVEHQNIQDMEHRNLIFAKILWEKREKDRIISVLWWNMQ